MSNVLTTETKKELDRRAWARFIAMGAAAAVVAGLGAVLALLPTLINVRIARAALERPTPALEEAREDSATASRAQTLVSAIQPLIAPSTPSDALVAALALQPNDISITSVSYQSASMQFILAGESSGRQALNAFRDALVASGRFSSVDVPVAALAGTQEGRFTLTLTGPFK